MARKTNRREFVQVAGLAASGFMATARPLAGASPEPQAIARHVTDIQRIWRPVDTR
jgi:hypothetical protein